MRKPMAAAGSFVFFVAAPCIVTGLVPWLLTRWRIGDPILYWAPLRAVGLVLLVTGAAVLIHSFTRFVTEGRGTPAPVAPTERLVVGGIYRHVRNPMYVAVVATIVGQALFLRAPVLLLYAATIGIVTWAFVRLYEEPTLEEQFGEQYEAYKRNVPSWRPQWRAWDPNGQDRS